MSQHLRSLLVAVVLTLAIALISGGRWPHFVIGAICASTLWLMLLIGSASGDVVARGVSWANYAMAAAITLLLGSVFHLVGGSNGAWWGAAAIMAASLVWPAARKQAADSSSPKADPRG